MNSRPIGSTPNRQHTTDLNHRWRGKVKSRMTREEKLEKRKRSRLNKSLNDMCENNDALESLCNCIRHGCVPYISDEGDHFSITFE